MNRFADRWNMRARYAARKRPGREQVCGAIGEPIQATFPTERRARVNAPQRIVSTVDESLSAVARRRTTFTDSPLPHSARNELFSRINDTIQALSKRN